MEATQTSCLQPVGRTVIVVDCEIRRPVVHSVLGQSPETGLLTVLNGNTALEDAIKSDRQSGIDYLPAPGPFPEAADVFASDRFKDLITRLSSWYDLVLLDTPPALLVQDAACIGQSADATLYAVRYDHTARQAVAEGIAALRARGVRVNGTVVTLTDRQQEARYAYAAHGAGYAAYANNRTYFAD